LKIFIYQLYFLNKKKTTNTTKHKRLNNPQLSPTTNSKNIFIPSTIKPMCYI